MSQLVIIERKTGANGHAVRKEDGKYLVSVEGNKETKEISESTFKKNFKLTGETVAEKAPKTKKVEKASEVKAEKETKVKAGTEKSVRLATFTGMFIGSEPYTAKLVDGLWVVDTHKKGVQQFDKNGIQVGARNPKFANKVLFVW
jgi:hypothetical protein